MNTGEIVIYALAGSLVVGVLLAIYRRRETVWLYVRWALVSLGSFLLAVIVLKNFTTDVTKIILGAALLEVLVAQRMLPRRSRYIPRSERRKAIARYERKTGQRYNPKRHHIDHVVPYSRGGSSRADNLRVLEIEKNLAKSAKAPWWDVFSR